MKNFNIEQLQKKTPYRFPENTFVEMQEKVLDRTIRKEKLHPKIFKINYSMVASIAAAFVLIFGLSFLWKTNQAELPKSQTNISTNTKKENNTTISDLKNNIENNVKNNNTEIYNAKNAEITKQIVNSKNTDENYDELLNSLSQEELSDLSKNTGSDIYLDLYN